MHLGNLFVSQANCKANLNETKKTNE